MRKKEKLNIVAEPKADFEKAELDLLRSAMKHSYTERFLMMTTLMKMDKMFRMAKIQIACLKRMFRNL
ncbi:hypothetical protein [Pelobium manganitolerans]|uniref:hypothetical protein n=1 Tax=Pelobium manganitolerans TaxID=1842495 RepID=UPI0011C3B214|nr:hypothetical protein [Pelobium manganitolerans]